MILLLMAFFSTIKPSDYADGASAEDWNRHSVWIRNYLNGDFSSFFVYPPLFHFFMAPFVLLFDWCIKYFQMILVVLVIASMSYYLYRKEGKKVLTLAFFMLSVSISFQIWCFQLMPQTLDYILFPMVLLLYFDKRYFTTSLGLTALVYNHLFGVVFLGTVFIHSLLYNKKFLKYFALILLLSAPIFYYYYLPEFISFYDVIFNSYKLSGSQTVFSENMQLFSTGWDRQFTSQWYMFLWSFGLLDWIFMPFVIYMLYKIRLNISETQKFYLIWFFCFLPILLFNVWRAVGYLIVPLTFFEASVLNIQKAI